MGLWLRAAIPQPSKVNKETFGGEEESNLRAMSHQR